MHPHPILMHTLHDDHNREVEPLLTRRQINQAYDARAESGSRHFLVERALALLAFLRRIPVGKAAGTAAPLRN